MRVSNAIKHKSEIAHEPQRWKKCAEARVGVELITLRLVVLTSSYGKLRAMRDSRGATRPPLEPP